MMSIKNIKFTVIFFLITFLGFSQTPEELIIGNSSKKDIIGKAITIKDWKSSKKRKDSKKTTKETTSTNSNKTFAAGTTTADFSVSLSGAGTYNIPIATPPGIRDIHPNIGLTYNTQASNGLAGWGWNISGLSTISKVGSTKFHDDIIDGVDYDTNDRFSLDGQRMVLKSGTYGASGSVYATERYNNIKIVANGQSSYGGPANFIVYYPDGSRSYFGHTNNSLGHLEWALWKKLDPQGNEIIYHYTNDNNLSTLDKILFGSIGSQPIEIKFHYKNRKRPELAYVYDISFKRTKILDKIEVKGNSQLYRRYQLTHDETSLGYERLISVQEFNGVNEGLAPISFVYDNSQSTGTDILEDQHSGTIYPGYNYQTDKVVSGEFNGDENMDFILYDHNTINIFDNIFDNPFNNTEHGTSYTVTPFDEVITNNMLNDQDQLLSQQGITLLRETINGSLATVEFESYYSGTTGLYHQYDKVWNTSTYAYETSPDNFVNKKIPKRYVSGDFNGDGLTDVLAIGEPYQNRYCSDPYPCKTSGGFINTQQEGESDEDFKTRKSDFNNNDFETSKIPDPNDPGDPTDDCYTCGTYTVSNKSVSFIDLNRNLTTGFVTSSWINEKLEANDRIIPADFNGDGKTDLFHFKAGEVFIYELDTNNQLDLIWHEVDSYINPEKAIILGDYNGDGKVDFITPRIGDTNNNWMLFLSKGHEIQKTPILIPLMHYSDPVVFPNWNYSNGPVTDVIREYKYSAVDVDGDGKSDLIEHNINSAYSSNHPYSEERFEIHTNVFNEGDNVPSFERTVLIADDNTGVTKRGFPIILNSYAKKDKIEYAYISSNRLGTYKFIKNHKVDMTLNQIINNGITHEIDYFGLSSVSDDFENIYNGVYDQVYPYVNVNIAPSLKLVEEVRESGGGLLRTQNYRYRSAVSHAKGLGFIGFKQTQKSNWFGDGVQTVWTISDFDPQKRGAVSRSWLALNNYDTPSSFINKTDYTYTTQLTSENIFINWPTQVVNTDNLSGVVKTETYQYDSFYNPLQVNTTYPGISNTVNYTYDNNYSAQNQNYYVGRTLGMTETSTINGNSFTSEEQFIYNNNLVSENKKRANASPWVSELFQYDAFGNVTQKTLQAAGMTNRVESFQFDSSGRYMTKSVDIEGLETNYTYQIHTGNPLTTTSPYGLTTSFNYDGWQRITKETNYLGKETIFTYSNANVSGIGGLIKIVNYDEGQDTKTYYNAFGWVTKESVLSLNNKWITKEVIFDVSGRKMRESEPYFSTDTVSQWNYFYFDEYGRPNSQQLYTGKVINTTYNNLTVTVDDGTKTMTKTSNAIGNIVTSQDPGGTINYEYFGNGEMKSAVYDNHTVSVTIDDWGRKASLTDPSAGTYTYDYNIFGEITKEVTPKGETNYTYDDAGKILTKKVTGDNTNIDLQYVYNGTTKLLTNINGIDIINNSPYNYTYEYDNYKRLKKVIENTNTNNFSKETTYDTFGRANTERYDIINSSTSVTSNIRIKNVYDSSGALIELRDGVNNNLLWKVNQENARQQALSISLGNGITKEKIYDQYGLLTNITDEDGSSNIQALKTDYSFNAIRGILNSRKNYAFNNWNETFTFDTLDRLTQINGATTHAQTYDARGRIDNNSFVGDYLYETNNAYRLKSIDLNDQGDLYYQQNSLQQVTYNAFKKPVKVYEENKGRIDFEYGPLMNRTHAYYGGLDDDVSGRKYHKKYSSIIPVEIIENNEDNSTKIIAYIGGDAYSAPIAHVKDTGNNIDEFHYLHRDYLGSILAISNSSTQIVEQSQYGAWGTVDKFLDSTGNTNFNHDSLLGRGFTGHEHFFEVSLIHMNGRMYDAHLGRFLSPDNYIQDTYNTQSFNRYSYVWNNPLSFSDPSGEFIHIIVGAVLGGVINLAVKAYQGEISSLGDGLAAFGIGAAAGALGAATGGASLAALGVGGAIGGAVAGAAGGLVGGFAQEFGNALYFQKANLNDALRAGSRGAVGGAIGGAILGGVIGGVYSGFKGQNVWTGSDVAAGRGVFSLNNTPRYTGANVNYGGSNVSRVINPNTISDTLSDAGISARTNNPIYKGTVDAYLQQMQSNTFDPVKNAVAGYLEGSSRAFITSGHHRVIAATIHGMQTGEYTILNTLINSGNFGSYSNAFSAGYQFTSFPKIWW